MRLLFPVVPRELYLSKMSISVNLSELSTGLHSLAVFRQLLSDPVVESLLYYLECRESGSTYFAVSAYGEFVSKLYASHETNLSRYIKHAVNNDENIYVKSIGRGEAIPKSLAENVDAELDILQQVCSLSPEILRDGLNWDGFMPSFESEEYQLKDKYKHRAENIEKYGYGIYAKYRMFRIDGDDHIVPVINPDNTRLSDLIDYKREQQIILDNTKALLAGKPAANVLLSGDAGTGKSSTVKAVVNELFEQGLRIIEVRKEQLREIPVILDELSGNPLKFILFIDDLSFQKDDDNFSALKAILEGTVSAKSNNVVIYATSNRRHLVKEKFSDRDGDDIHHNDTMQETISLSERFGIQITFQRPDKKTYLGIVHHLADSKGITYDAQTLDAEAEKFALMRGTRSARAAKQFVDSLLANK